MLSFLLGFYFGGVFVVSTSADMADENDIIYSPTFADRIIVGLCWPYHVIMGAVRR